jgi:hypothetical protein
VDGQEPLVTVLDTRRGLRLDRVGVTNTPSGLIVGSDNRVYVLHIGQIGSVSVINDQIEPQPVQPARR